jgi:hypothetical protein
MSHRIARLGWCLAGVACVGALAGPAAGQASGSGAAPRAVETLNNGAYAESPDNFSILQIATTDPDKLVKDWAQPTAGVHLTTETEVTRNKPIVTFIVFKGCQADASGHCDVTAAYAVFDPAGKPYAQQTGVVWKDAPTPDLNLQLSLSALGLLIEDKDPLGPYRVEVTVTDRVSGVTLRTKQILTAVAN